MNSSKLTQSMLKWSHILGILAALGLNFSLVTTQFAFTLAEAITKGSAVGVPLSIACLGMML